MIPRTSPTPTLQVTSSSAISAPKATPRPSTRSRALVGSDVTGSASLIGQDFDLLVLDDEQRVVAVHLPVGLERDVAEDRVLERAAADLRGHLVLVERLDLVRRLGPDLERGRAERHELVRVVVEHLLRALDEFLVVRVGLERLDVGEVDVG